MVTVRKGEAGFTLTETMVVVVILGILAAVSTPMLTRDNTARQGRDWAKIVAQTLQRARFQAMGDRANIHVLLYRTHVDLYRQTGTSFVLLSRTRGPHAGGTPTIAVWDANTSGTAPTTAQLTDPDESLIPSFVPSLPSNDIAFSSLGSTVDGASWWIYVRNELLTASHPDASFLVTVRGLTGFITTNNKVTLP
jgi:prepilin-type N-terminal cleavage/methylation domain-containing protein